MKQFTNINSASIKAFHGNVEALPLCSKPIGHRDSAVLKYHGSGWLRVPTYLKDVGTPIINHNSDDITQCCHLLDDLNRLVFLS